MTSIGVVARIAGLLGLVLVVWAPLEAGHVQESVTAPTPSPGVPLEMYEFLDAWLVYGNMTEAMTYFDGSKLSLSLAPSGVQKAPRVKEFFFEGRRPEVRSLSLTERTAYWNVLNQVWPRPDTDRLDGVGLSYILNPVRRELVAGFAEELGARILSTDSDPFLVFEADSEVVLYSFDPGFGDIGLLLDDDTRTLGMLAELAHRTSPDDGPFVSFWGEKARGVWRIQALGAIRQ